MSSQHDKTRTHVSVIVTKCSRELSFLLTISILSSKAAFSSFWLSNILTLKSSECPLSCHDTNIQRPKSSRSGLVLKLSVYSLSCLANMTKRKHRFCHYVEVFSRVLVPVDQICIVFESCLYQSLAVECISSEKFWMSFVESKDIKFSVYSLSCLTNMTKLQHSFLPLQRSICIVFQMFLKESLAVESTGEIIDVLVLGKATKLSAYKDQDRFELAWPNQRHTSQADCKSFGPSQDAQAAL